MNDYKPKVSVIVPVYNVEKYIKRCLDAIIAQSYENWEAILVDDGSTDSSGEICDKYCSRDNRFRVLHQSNGGISNARNTALEVCRGDFVAFCDSDDYYEPCILEYLTDAAVKDRCDIAMCKFFFIDENDIKMESSNSAQPPDGTYSSERLMEFMFERRIQNYVCNKLYHRHLFDNVRFENGMPFEDALVAPSLYSKANGISIISYAGYAYFRYRSGNISSSKKVLNELSLCRSNQIRCELAKQQYPRYIKTASVDMLNSYVNLCLNWTWGGCVSVKEKKLWESAKKLVREIYNDKKICDSLPFKIRIRGRVSIIAPWILPFLANFLRGACSLHEWWKL